MNLLRLRFALLIGTLLMEIFVCDWNEFIIGVWVANYLWDMCLPNLCKLIVKRSNYITGTTIVSNYALTAWDPAKI
jgi:hypothetical protein